jgi:hypothetical protein
MDATLIGKPAPTNLVLSLVQDLSLNGLDLLAMDINSTAGKWAGVRYQLNLLRYATV